MSLSDGATRTSHYTRARCGANTDDGARDVPEPGHENAAGGGRRQRRGARKAVHARASAPGAISMHTNSACAWRVAVLYAH